MKHGTALLAALVTATAGSFLQIGGASWDVMSHLLRQPETFFTPSHTVLYAGAGLAVAAAAAGASILLRDRRDGACSPPFSTAFKLLAIGSAIQVASGPGDFAWHAAFGVDGLLSPPHLALATGIIVNSVAAVVGLARIAGSLPSAWQRRAARAALVPALASFWLATIWYVYMFTLPLSDGERLVFSPDPVAAAVISVAALPFVSSLAFVVSARILGRPGAAVAAAAVLVGMNTFATILPAGSLLAPFLPVYLSLSIGAPLAADVVLHRLGPRYAVPLAGAIVGSVFYVFNYPMLPMTFAELAPGQPNELVSDILPGVSSTLAGVMALTALPGAVSGMAGAIMVSKKIRMPRPGTETATATTTTTTSTAAPS